MNPIKTNLRQKPGLFFFGIIITIFLLEIILRIGGLTYSLYSRYGTRDGSKEKRFRIICLGESTTFMGDDTAYPRQLEKILNQKQDTVSFEVINLGVPSIETGGILSQLEYNLRTYKPDLVLTMMGINDTGETKIYQDALSGRMLLFFKNIRFIKFGKFCYFFLRGEIQELKLNLITHTQRKPKPRLTKREKILKNHICYNPKDTWAYLELADYYAATNEHDQRERVCSLALLSNRFKDWPYVYLGSFYAGQGNKDKAQEIFENAIARNSQKYWPYRIYGRFLQDVGRYQEAKKMFLNAIERSPSETESSRIYFDLGSLYIKMEDYQKALEVFEKAKVYLSNDKKFLTELAEIYEQTDQSVQAQEILESIERLDDNVDELYSLNSTMTYRESTKINYRKLVKELNQRRTDIIVVQYPSLNIDALKQLLKGLDVLDIVDNELSFREAVKKEGFEAYFTDRFANLFGHCSPKGNHLLAQNIAESIFRNIISVKK